MSDFVIHVGLPRTGSTFLQAKVFPKIRNTKVFGATNKIHFDILCDFSDSKLNIISDEALCGVYVSHNYTVSGFEIANRLKRLLPDAKIMAVFRDKQDWFKSAYSQYIKAGGVEDFNTWHNKVCHYDGLNYVKYEEHLRYLFNKVLICHYEILINNPHEYVKEICEFIGVNVPKFENVKLRPRLTDFQIKYWRKINTLFKSKGNPSGGIIPGRYNPLDIYRKILLRHAIK